MKMRALISEVCEDEELTDEEAVKLLAVIL